MYIFIYKVCTDMLLKFYTAFTKKVFVVPKYPIPLKPYPFCVCFTVFYILNDKLSEVKTASVVYFVFVWQICLQPDVRLTAKGVKRFKLILIFPLRHSTAFFALYPCSLSQLQTNEV